MPFGGVQGEVLPRPAPSPPSPAELVIEPPEWGDVMIVQPDPQDELTALDVMKITGSVNCLWLRYPATLYGPATARRVK